jgi:hypothetical protein
MGEKGLPLYQNNICWSTKACDPSAFTSGNICLCLESRSCPTSEPIPSTPETAMMRPLSVKNSQGRLALGDAGTINFLGRHGVTFCWEGPATFLPVWPGDVPCLWFISLRSLFLHNQRFWISEFILLRLQSYTVCLLFPLGSVYLGYIPKQPKGWELKV